MTAQNAQKYLIATTHDWNVRRYYAVFGQHKDWFLFDCKDKLLIDNIIEIRPRYIFFPHWSWRVQEELLQQFECVCFHMTDVPYGRGGSPLQNLIVRGHTETMLTALRMVPEMDAGPVYMKRPLSLEGTAQEIYERASELAFEMMAEIAEQEPDPVPQIGEPTYFKRRTPDMSELPSSGELEDIYDYIRMLDAEAYPKAFVKHGDLRLVLDRATRVGDAIEAHVRITKDQEEK